MLYTRKECICGGRGAAKIRDAKKVQLIGFENVANIEVLNIVNGLPLLAYFVTNIW